MGWTLDTLLEAIEATKCPMPSDVVHDFTGTWFEWSGDDAARAALRLLRWRNRNSWRPLIADDDLAIEAEGDTALFLLRIPRDPTISRQKVVDALKHGTEVAS